MFNLYLQLSCINRSTGIYVVYCINSKMYHFIGNFRIQISMPSTLLFMLILKHTFGRGKKHLCGLKFAIPIVLVQVVPTEYNYLSKEVLPTNQFSVTEYFSPMHEFERTWPGTIFLMFVYLFKTFLQKIKVCEFFIQLSTFYMIYHRSRWPLKRNGAVFYTS